MLILLIIGNLTISQLAIAGNSTNGTSIVDQQQAELLRQITEISSRSGPPSAYQNAMDLSALMYRDAWHRLQEEFEFTHISHPAIDKQIDFLRSGIRTLQKNLSASRPYLFFVMEALSDADVPADIALLPLIESAFDPIARSSQNARGLWQFMPATAETVGLTKNRWYDGRLDPFASTHAAIRYLKQLHKTFDEDWLLALAAYNAGPGNVRAAIRKAKARGRPINFWNLKLPAETTNYVPRLIAATRIVANPELYQLSLPEILNQPHVTTVSIGQQISITQAAVLAKLPAQHLRDLNTAYASDKTPPGGPHRLTVPVAHAQALLTGLRKHNFRLLNHAPFQSQAALLPLPLDTGPTSPDMRHSNNVTAQNFKAPVTYHYRTHTVKKGDTLWDLANSMGADVKTLMEWNHLPDDITNLQVGSKLRVAYLAPPDPDAGQIKTMKYRVTYGETLISIGDKFSLRIHELKKWNPALWQKNSVRAGQTLRIPIY